MKTLIKTTLLTLVLVTALSCKKNDPASQDAYATGSDSTGTTIDTVVEKTVKLTIDFQFKMITRFGAN